MGWSRSDQDHRPRTAKLKAIWSYDIDRSVSLGYLVVSLGSVLLVAATAQAQNVSVGDETLIEKTYETVQTRGDGTPMASSRGRDGLLERVVAIRADGLELVYDLPRTATTADRARSWQFPARVFQPHHGAMTLLNHDELETRLVAWLKAANLDRAQCGRWIFTWNAFRIECDPQSVLATISAFDLRTADLGDKALYADKDASGPGRLAATPLATGGQIYSTELPVDPEVIHRARAESDVVVGTIMQQPVTPDAALKARRKDGIEGIIAISLEADAAGEVRRRKRVVRLRTNRADGSTEIETNTETVERLYAARN